MAVSNCLFKRLLQTRLDNVDVAALKGFDGFLVDVEAADLKTGFSEGDRGRQAKGGLRTAIRDSWNGMCRTR